VPSPAHGRWPGKRGGAHQLVDGGTTRRRRWRRRVARRTWTSVARRRATGTGERVSADGATGTHRRGGVDGGVDGSDATATTSDRASTRLWTAAVETARRSDAVRQRRSQTAWAAARSVSSGACSDRGCPNGAIGAAFKPPGAFGHCRPQQPIRVRRGTTLPLIGGPHALVFFELK
jgi:hypothetical protein